MWECPKCKRKFKNNNQSHFCSKDIEIVTIDQYIDAQVAEVQPILRQIRKIIREQAPLAEERMSWRMPTFWQKENLIHFAAAKKHIGIYPGAEAIEVFQDKLTAYKTSKGAIQLPLTMAIPYDLIAEITAWRVSKVEE